MSSCGYINVPFHRLRCESFLNSESASYIVYHFASQVVDFLDGSLLRELKNEDYIAPQDVIEKYRY